MQYFLGIDIGTGSTKAVAISRKGTVLFATQSFYPADIGHTQQAPELLWAAFVAVMQATGEKLGVPPQAVALSSAMHSIMVVDDGGTPQTPLLTWADDRAAGVAEKLLAEPEGPALYAQTGTPVHAFSPLCKLKWWQEQEPSLIAQAHKLIGIKEWIWHRLFNVYEIDYSLASATGLFNLSTLQWNESSLNFTGINHGQLSAPVPTTTHRTGLRPAAAAALALPASTTFVIGASDGCLANLGTAALQPGTAAITVGTSGAVRVAVTAPRAIFPEQLFNYYLDEGIWITGGAINNGGAALAWISQVLGHDGVDEQQLEATRNVVPGSDGLLFLPYLMGERAPIWDSRSSGAFIGLQQKHGAAHLLRAVIEGVCLALRSVLEPLEKTHGTVHTLHLSGGFTRSDAALQVLADCMGKKLMLLQTEDASAIGAAFLGMKALGLKKDLAEIPGLEAGKTFLPNEATAACYNELFSIYTSLFGLLKDPMHRLRNL